jgi:hypothetical protein
MLAGVAREAVYRTVRISCKKHVVPSAPVADPTPRGILPLNDDFFNFARAKMAERPSNTLGRLGIPLS